MDKQQVNDKINRVENSPKNAYNAFIAQRLRQLASTWKGKNADAQFLHFLAGTYCKTGEEPGCPSRKCRRLSTGLNSLDKFTKGLANGNLMVVGGYKEQGKTAFALSLVNHICLEKQVPTAFFSLNSSKEDIFMRLIGNRALVEWSFLQKKQIPPNQWDKAMQAYK